MAFLFTWIWRAKQTLAAKTFMCKSNFIQVWLGFFLSLKQQTVRKKNKYEGVAKSLQTSEIGVYFVIFFYFAVFLNPCIFS